MSVHNFIIGEMYVDIGDTMTITKIDSDLQASISFTRRGWSNKDMGKLEGVVHRIDAGNNKTPFVLISGNWTSKIYVQRILPEEGERQCILTRNPYPE